EALLPPHKHDTVGYAYWLDRFFRETGLAGKKLVLASVATGAPIATHYTWENPDQVTGLVMHLPFLGKVAIPPKWARPVVAYALPIAPVRTLVDNLPAADELMHAITLHDPPEPLPNFAEPAMTPNR